MPSFLNNGVTRARLHVSGNLPSANDSVTSRARDNRSQDIRAAQFVNDERRRPTDPSGNGQNSYGVLPNEHHHDHLYRKSINWWGRQNAAPLKFDRPKAVGGGIFDCFSNFNIYRPEFADDVITGKAVEQVSMYVRGKFCDYILNSGRII